MIYELSRDLEDMLRARKYPYRVVYGPERVKRHIHHSTVIVERDRKADDEISASQGQQRNPRKVGVRTLACKARLFVRSSKHGAHIGDHERECEALVDAFLVSLEEWMTEGRAGALDVREARYVDASEFDDVEEFPGVAYVLRFRVPRAVMRLDFTGEARPQSAVAGTSNEVHVRVNDDDPPEIVELP